jgi:RHS repeat-associated protein
VPVPSQHTVRIVVEDGYGGIGSQTYTLHVGQQAVNRPPIISSIPAYQAAEGATYRYQVAARDPEGGPVRFELGASRPGMTVEATTGLITWPNAQFGDHTVTVVAFDDQDARATQSYLLAVQPNQPPVIRAIADRSVLAGAQFAYDVWASDPDGSLFDLTFELAESPAGMTIDSRGRILWTTTDADVALSPFTVRPVVTDPLGASAETTFTITVVPDTEAPRVELAVSTNLAQQGGTVRVQVRATDNRGVASITLMVGGAPLPLNPVNGYAETSVTMDTPGMIDIVAVAADAAGNQASSPPWQVRVFDPTDQAWPQVSILALQQLELVDGQPAYRELARAGDAITEPVTYLANLYATVDDENLEFWRVEYAKTSEVDLSALHQADPDYTLLAQGTASYLDANTPIALFDATLLSNDAYVIRVLARDVGGRISTKGLLVGVSGDAKLGNFRLDFTDLTVPLAGIPINITRTYDTLNAGTEGDFGYGWSMAITAADIAETTRPGAEMQPGHRVYLTNPEGKRIGFTYDPELNHQVSMIGYFGTIYTPRFKADPGVYETLTVKDGTYMRGGVFGSITAALGNSWNPSQYVLTTRDGTVYDYVQGEGLKKITDANNNVITFTPTAIKHTSGAQIDLIRDARGRVKQIVAPGPAPGDDPIRLNYIYNAARDLVGFTNQMSETVTYGYSTDSRYPHFLTTITDSRGVPVFEAQFGEDGRLIGSTDALRGSVRQEFQPGSFTGTIWDARQNPTTLLYNQRGNVLEETDPLGQTTYYEYADPRFPDLETKITDRNGTVELRQYDAAGNLKSVTRAAGTAQEVTTDYAYDSRSNLTSIRQAGQPPTVFSYDTPGNLTTITNAIGDVATATYDSQGRQMSFTDFNGHTTTYDYTNGCSSCGSPSWTYYPDGTFDYRQYDRYGRLTYDGTTTGRIQINQYDLVGRVVREQYGWTDPMVKTLAYDKNLLKSETIVHPTDPSQNRTTRYDHDAAGQIIRQTDAEGGVVEFRYDANANRVLLQDPVGNITTWVYDALDRMVEERDPFYWVEYVAANPARFDGLAGEAFLTEIVSANNEPSGASAALNQGAPHVRVFGYDGEGNQTKIIDRNGRRREFDHDPLGRLIEERWYNPDGTLVRTVTSTYDQRGNLQSITDPDSSYTYTYDVLNRVTTIDNAGSPDMPHVVLSYAYDAMGNVTRTSDNFGVTVESQYDSRNRLSQRLWYGGDIDPARVDFFYNAIGREERVDRYADLEGVNRVASTDSTYYTTGATRQIIHRNATDEVIAAYEYQYDFAGLLTREDRYGQSYANNDWRADYGYDRTGQLLSATYTGADVIPEQVDEYYRYDANGNRVESYLHGTGYRTGPANQLQTDGTYDYQYDAEGNMVKKTEIATGKVTTFEYDHRNLMVQATIWSSDPSNGGVILHEAEYQYDAFDRRIRMVSDGESLICVYDGKSFLANEWARFKSTGYILERFMFANRVDQLVAEWTNSRNVAWCLSDNLGTIRDTINSNDKIVQHMAYTSFGQPMLSESFESVHPYAFTSRVWDSISGLSFHRARYYDGSVGRFTSFDPISFAASDFNLYRYSFNGPTIASDPSGLMAIGEYALTARVALVLTAVRNVTFKAVFSGLLPTSQFVQLGLNLTGLSARLRESLLSILPESWRADVTVTLNTMSVTNAVGGQVVAIVGMTLLVAAPLSTLSVLGLAAALLAAKVNTVFALIDILRDIDAGTSA